MDFAHKKEGGTAEAAHNATPQLDPNIFPTTVIDASGEKIEIVYACDSNTGGGDGQTGAGGTGGGGAGTSGTGAPVSQSQLSRCEDSSQNRVTWGGKIEFMLTCIGYAVGLGNVWRFPYLCHEHGGGAFLLPYMIMLMTVGIPLFFLEFAFGQFASLGPLSVWNISPLFKGIGFSMVFVSAILGLYYNVIIAHCILYFAASFTNKLAWGTCDNWWNNVTECKSSTVSSNMSKVNMILMNESTKASTEEYYEKYILNISDDISDFGYPQWKVVLALLAAWIIVAIVLIKGIQSLGKISYFTATFPYLMLTILLIRSLFLKGSMDGIRYYVTPVFSKIWNPRVWTDAATQIFFSLSCANGGLITMSSFNKFTNNCCKDAVIVALINCFTSIYAGFVVFANLGFMAHIKNKPVKNVTKSGPGLVFVVYPEALSNMPLAPLWAVLFFMMMVTLGFGSQFSIVETVISGFKDELDKLNIFKKPWHDKIYRIIVCAVAFLLGLPMTCRGGIYLLTILDSAISGFPLLIIAFIEISILSYLYGIKQFFEDIKMMLKAHPNLYWKVMWIAVTPAILLALTVFYFYAAKPIKYGLYIFPEVWQHFGNCIGVFCVILIPVLFLYRYCIEGGFIVLREYLKPHPDWGPSHSENRMEFIKIIKEKEKINGRTPKSDSSNAIKSDQDIKLIESAADLNVHYISTDSFHKSSITETKFFQNKMTVAKKLEDFARRDEERLASKENNMKIKVINSAEDIMMKKAGLITLGKINSDTGEIVTAATTSGSGGDGGNNDGGLTPPNQTADFKITVSSPEMNQIRLN